MSPSPKPTRPHRKRWRPVPFDGEALARYLAQRPSIPAGSVLRVKLCPCGNPATQRRAGALCCDRCAA